MSVEDPQDLLPILKETSDTLSSTSVLSWIQKLHSPGTPSYIPHLEKSPTRATKRCRSLGSTPSEFLGESASYYKRLKVSYEKKHDVGPSEVEASEKEQSDMGDDNVARLLTPSADTSTSSSSRTPSRPATASILKGPSNSTPHTPKRQKTNTSEDAIGYKMSLNDLKQDDKAFDEALEFKQYVTDLVSSDRGSVMRAASVKRFRDHANAYKCSTEATFLHYMIPLLQGYGYHVAAKPEFAPGEEEMHLIEAKEWKEFLADEGILGHINQNFTRTLLPNKFSQTPGLIDEIARALEKDKDMTNPRPDFTYGLTREKHPLDLAAPMAQEIYDLLEIVPGMHHAFLIIEGKSPGGSETQAQNQARRGGATLVKALQKLRAEIVNDNPPPPSEETATGQFIIKSAVKRPQNPISPDYTCFVFSITTSPTYFDIWVHWYDKGNNKYHMNNVDSFALKNSKGPVQIRWAMHNIMEWGARTRRDQNDSLIRSIEDRVQRDVQKVQDVILAAQRQTETAKAAANAAKLSGKGAGPSSAKRSRPDDEDDEV